MDKTLKFVRVAWVINALLFVFAWFGGDIAIHAGYDYMTDSIEAMRWLILASWVALSFAALTIALHTTN